MRPHLQYTTLMISISLCLFVCCFFIITFAYSEIVESVVMIRDSRNIKNNPDELKSDIEILEQRRELLASRFERVLNLKKADLESFNSISRQSGLKLTGVSLKERSALKNGNGKGYQLIFSGQITDILNTLNYIESNLAVFIESVSIYSNASNNQLVDLKLNIIIPEQYDEIRKN